MGYDPVRDLPPDHLARLVEQAVQEALGALAPKPSGRDQMRDLVRRVRTRLCSKCRPRSVRRYV